MKEAQQKKDLELAEKIKLADKKLASVTKLEQENTNLKAALGKKNDRGLPEWSCQEAAPYA